ncbi:hypothetical protein PPYC2_21525 [Paenibacillus polymyxa]|uniref:hypothetical protein n=1 Tax=Paenibacillus polymyxa TaxID=1406 RepID=UPI0008FB60A8|nr:hypothetical protein [Paenibacillus polymyxa]APB77368.1 hypothetical protein PPYC2_21525 [Paenibacillus polymyxa]
MGQHVYSISIMTTVGEISEKKIETIKNLGLIVETLEIGQSASFRIQETGDLIMIAPNQISFAKTGDNIDDFNADWISEWFNKILDILLLDRKYALQFFVQRSFKANKGLSTETAKEFLKNDVELLFDGSLSVAYRIPFKKDNFQGEVRIEPFFANPEEYFVSVVANSQIVGSSSQFINEMASFVNDEIQPIAHKLF